MSESSLAEAGLLFAATFCASSLVSGNNLSACVGTAIGSRVLTKRFGYALGAAGFVLGLLGQGGGMERTASHLLPIAPGGLVSIEILFATVFIFLIGKLLRVPLSVTMSLVGLLLGISASRHLPVDTPLASIIIASWFVAPLLAISATLYFMKVYARAGSSKNIWRQVKTYKVLLVALSFLSAYVLGTNSIALVVAIGGFTIQNVVVAVAGILFGSFFLGRGQIKRVGEDFFSLRYSNALSVLFVSTILFEGATLLGIPLSSTQTLTSGVVGAGLSYRIRYIPPRPLLVIILGWIVAPLLSFLIGYVLI